MIRRDLEDRLQQLVSAFPVLTVTGPRQAGKTTLVRRLFADYAYVSLEDLDAMAAAEEDPRRFLRGHGEQGLVIDEAQRVPSLFSYLQGVVDASGQMGRYVLTGSQNFLLLEKVSQSLAGRCALLHLMPFTATELLAEDLLASDLDQVMHQGFYPPVFDRPVAPADFYPSYIETYVERDLRSIRNVGNLNLFRKFLLLCAGRVGQLVNMSSLGNDVGVDHKTISSWLSILEASFIIHLLQPYYRNMNKRLVKQPKLYFHDTGLLCSLLGLRKAADLATHHLRGSIFENYVIAECIKQAYHHGRRPGAYFWRDHSGHEVDLLVEDGPTLRAVEIKSGETLHSEFFAGLKWISPCLGIPPADCALVYGGDQTGQREAGQVLPWHQAHRLFVCND